MLKTALRAMVIGVAAATVMIPAAQAQAPMVGVEVREEGSVGTIFGTVREPMRGASLPGARVTVGDRTVTTESDGSFRIAGVQPGSYTLSVNYLGYRPFSTTIEVGAAAGVRADIALAVTARGEMEEVRVRAIREGQALALNQQRSSINAKNVVSADLLGRFPDINLAEATQRIPGVSIERDQGEGRFVNVRGAPLEFTNVSVDGVQLAAPNPGQRAVELDTIPPDVIATLEVTKAITPDMDGDAIAGQINIVTQSALDRDGMILRGSLGTGKFELGQGKNERGNLTIGGQFGENDNIGILVAASGSRQGRLTDNVETEFFTADDGRILPEVTEIKDYDGERTRYGFTGRFDWRIDENHLLYAIGTYSRFRDEEFRNTFTLEYERHAPAATELGGLIGRATFDKEIRERVQQQTITTLNIGGEHFINEWQAKWQVNYAEGEFKIPTRRQFIYRSTLRPPLAYDFGNPNFPTWTLLKPDGSVLQEGINLPESLYGFRRFNDRLEDALEEEVAFRVDLARPQNFLGDSGDISFGVRARIRDKQSNDDRFRNGTAAEAPQYSTLLCPRVSNNFGRFEFGRVFCNDVFDRFADGLRTDNLRPLVEASLANDFTVDEDIYATYFRVDAKWDRLTMVTGLRVEHTDVSSNANLFDRVSNTASPLNASDSYTNFLPSVHLRYDWTDETIVRWSYSTGIARPNFIDTVPRLNISDEERSASAGNPDLDPTYAHNLDFSVEHYMEPLGLISGGVFYKRLKDTIFNVARIDTVQGIDSVRISQPLNGGSGRIYGAEIAWQQTFDMLPEPFDGLGVYTNYTLTDSTASAPLNGGTVDLPGASRHNLNLAAFYEKYGFNARLAYNHRSKYIQAFDIGNPDLNVFWDARSVLDFTTSYQITDQWIVFAEVNNITDTRQKRFQGQSNRVLELEEFGRFWLVGVRFDL